ncbi:MAG: 3-isopropylmalate dehydrogenase [Alphaproteobacteria bacterium]|nr:3-isopropylmalate dehydrogenase [Alphaproteobacteria bacterium]
MLNLLFLAGDGIGPEVMQQARRVLEWLGAHKGLTLSIKEDVIGGAAIDAHGVPLTDATIAAAKAADAVFLGAVGGPKWANVAYDKRPEAGLLGIRKALALFANLRPAVVFDALVDASSLKAEYVRGLDVMIVRELVGGVYFGQPRGIETLADGQKRGFNTQAYSSNEIERVARVAFELARARGKKLCSVDKANVMESSVVWREVVTALHTKDYSDIALSHMYVDNCAMQLCRTPKQFDVILTDNLFGDILSDEASMLTGSIGMLPSASLGAAVGGERAALYEPVHGSAPDIAGQDKANPLAAILCVEMWLRYSLGNFALADLVGSAVAKVLASGARTADIATPGQPVLTTQQMGDAVLKNLV